MTAQGGSYVLIAGQGRSGTNWILDILDLCENTWCRNEPNELINSAMASLADGTLIDSEFFPDTDDWTEVIRKTGEAFGDRDRVGKESKDYYRASICRHLVQFIYDKPRVRKPLKSIFSHFELDEWVIPRFFLDDKQRSNRLTIVKVNQMPAWSHFILDKDGNGKVIHIVRHPGGFLNSWKNRYLRHMCSAVVLLENRTRLERLAGLSETWRKRMGNIIQMSLPETELWYWLYANEETYRIGLKNNRYKLVVFEKLAGDYKNEVKDILEFSTLNISKEQEKEMFKLGDNSISISDGWKQSLNTEEKSLVERILDNSELSSLWPVDGDHQSVSKSF
jgi:hypothetical protein